VSQVKTSPRIFILNLREKIMNGLAICAGIGGIELGLGLAVPEYRTIGYMEKDPFAVDTLFARMEDGILEQAPIWNDVVSFNPECVQEQVDIISAGFPCQPWSVAGKKKGLQDERWIWPEIYRIVCQIRPRYVFLENVMGLCNQGLGHVLRDLAQSGYDAEWDLFSVKECEGPQLRERLFILAYTKGKHGHRIQASRREERNALRQAGDDDSGFQNRPKPGLPLWPPGPDEIDDWREVVTTDITVKPTLCGMVDGISPELEQSVCMCRAGRFRALGNAVVPVVAALAFLTLSRRAASIE
jgi:DNA (cytosine-5)-methyltransferase 1